MQVERDTKPWAGQLYLSHTNEATCKLLYKKFFRNTDCTILNGPWKQMLLEQQRVYQVDGLSNTLSSSVIRESPNECTACIECSPPLSPSSLSSSYPLSNASPRIQYKSKSNKNGSSGGLKIASSRHGAVSPSQLEPFQCFVLFYTSSWVVPQLKNRRLAKIFGPDLVRKIEAYIRDEFNGEQCPGTSFLLETESTPCRFIVCTSVARNMNYLSPDYAYNAFRSSLLSIYNYNKNNPSDQITSILCPAMELITSASAYNMVHQMATCYEYWDWHLYAKGSVLPFTHEDEENINKQIKASNMDLVRISQDLEHYIRMGILASRGLVYECELHIILDWLTNNKVTGKNKKNTKKHQCSTDIPLHIIAQTLVDVVKRPDIPPFTLTPSQICSGLTGPALGNILKLAQEGSVKVYTDIKLQDLKLGRVLAEGNSGKVHAAYWGTREVAAKVFKQQEPEEFMKEIAVISLVKHPKLLEPLGGFFDKNTALMVTEIMDMNLLQLLQNKAVQLPFSAKLRIAIDIAEAMDFLHSRGVMHRDLKSVNVLVNQHTYVAKVCDFGLSRMVDCTSTLTKNVGTSLWIAPEIFQEKAYTEKCDVYSFGIILSELITQVLPYKELPLFSIPESVKKGTRPTIPQEVVAVTPKDYLDLMKKCWHAKPQQRPSFSDILTTLQSFVARDVPIPNTLNKQPDFYDDDESYYADSSDEEATESSSETVSGNMQEQEEVVMAELKPWIKTIRHPLVSEELLLKCIRARNCKPIAAKHLLLRYVEWYQLLTSGRPIKISDVRKTLESQVLYYVEGACDKLGRNIIFWDVSKYEVDVTPEPVLMRAFVYCLERATETHEAQTKGVILLANLTDYNMSRFSTRIVHSFFGTVQKYFPVIVPRMLFLNAPGGFFKILTMYQSFISSTMDVIELVTLPKLLEYVTTDNLIPAAHGTFHFDIDLWIRSRHATEGVEYQQ